jgi:hypothetical protein
MTGLTLDAGALIALERDDRSFARLLANERQHGGRITIPASALAQAMRSPARQVRLVRLCRHQTTDLIPLDGPDATAVGLLLAATRTTDIVDAHVVVCALRAGQPVVTSDPQGIRRLAPGVIAIKV